MLFTEVKAYQYLKDSVDCDSLEESIAKKARVTMNEMEAYLSRGPLPISREVELKIEDPLTPLSSAERNLIKVRHNFSRWFNSIKVPVVPVLLTELKETLLSEIKPESQLAVSSESGKPTSKNHRSKRVVGNTTEGDLKFGGALVAYHKYKDGSCTNFTPISCKDLGRQLNLSTNTASLFFKKHFRTHSKYVTICGNSAGLNDTMQFFNGETMSPILLFGLDADKLPAKPTPESELDD